MQILAVQFQVLDVAFHVRTLESESKGFAAASS
jgi:hypothetical protein